MIILDSKNIIFLAFIMNYKSILLEKNNRFKRYNGFDFQNIYDLLMKILN